ncbi:epoxyqueuosine reductase [Acetohalobium arabaticum]|uniref:4Fe-4S ferredoxin iron-sulfur binding domain-containing protein n=1 Tax=Acetohalobium arabaticum (strain ATCC 49924 / DSM 5501 / Z-7288) TaxID=574087 RepID=D9QQG3_ACEAZ|nr:epoxyqueuosine reductase [Acetohalobium arabaticum]ADL12754.1 4Fe-4S ferredoxin iron-sulfur binding domain-containing protein [Acetohalobium arabaticum DSM 5501]
MIKELITKVIKKTVSNSDTKTEYRQPLVGFADADDNDFKKLEEVIAAEHKLPSDILSGAETVISFFIPFAREVIEANQHQKECALKWGIAYHETNELISKICFKLQKKLAKESIEVGWQSATHNFDEERLISFWSHRSIAKICGLGDFGLNRMLITEQGSAGRYGSLVMDQYVTPSAEFKETPCLYYRDGSCGVCVDRCPKGALTKERFDRHLCYEVLLKNNEIFQAKLKEYDGSFDVCGKCQITPCAFGIPE